ncbi:MAG: ATP-binding cassette domain-containing protein [Alicyclobacillaceae bacterium]|nr:ATP-binding cassette domain-containing protein [Alicyclobacillaceae bacterium]
MRLRVDGISYRYPRGSQWVLQDVSFHIRRGEVAAVVGKSGSGKSTLGYILGGVIPNLVRGGQLEGGLAVEPSDAGVGLVTQVPENQLFGYRVEDAIVFGLENMGLRPEEIERRFNRVLDLLSLRPLRKRPVHTLSGGQKQIVCIASVLVMEPGVLVLDEPVGSLDPMGKALVQQVLKDLKAGGQTILILDQNLDWSAEMVDRVIGLDRGRVVFDGSLQQFFMRQDLYQSLGAVVPEMVELYHACAAREWKFPFFMTVEEAFAAFKDWGMPGLPEPGRPWLREGKERRPVASPPLLEVRNVVCDLDGFLALKGVETAFSSGCVTAVLGQNGSGKTTLVKHLNGLLKPTSGSVLFRGRPTEKKSVAEMARSVAFVFQHPDHMLFEDSVWKEITFSIRAQGKNPEDTEVARLLQAYGLWDDRDAFPLNLSMGKKHMLTILAVLLTDPEVVILDEPTIGMDNDFRKRLIRLIKELRSRGKAVVLISHEIPFVAEVSDVLVLMKDGQILNQGQADQVFGKKELFQEVNIPRPQVIQLVEKLNFSRPVATVDQFVQHILRGTEIPWAGGKGREVDGVCG